MSAEVRPLIAHLVHRFDYGGLENGLVNLVNSMPAELSRHAIIAITESSEIASRVSRKDVDVYELHKRPGIDLACHVRVYRLLRRIRPDIVHTRNVGTMEYQVAAWLAGARRRVHGEHGWDTNDPEGKNLKYRMLRRLLSPLIERFVPLSIELSSWLQQSVRIPSRKITRICNGVDCERIRPAAGLRDTSRVTIGTVTRFSDIKDPMNTVDAFIRLRATLGERGKGVKLLMVGDGPLRPGALEQLRETGFGSDACLPGNALDVVPWLHRMDIFVLGSLKEGISNTILEAMAAGLPVVATRVGGNVELVLEGVTGALVPPGSPNDLAGALARYVDDAALRRAHGIAGRERAEREFSLNHMVSEYASVYFANAER